MQFRKSKPPVDLKLRSPSGSNGQIKNITATLTPSRKSPAYTASKLGKPASRRSRSEVLREQKAQAERAALFDKTLADMGMDKNNPLFPSIQKPGSSPKKNNDNRPTIASILSPEGPKTDAEKVVENAFKNRIQLGETPKDLIKPISPQKKKVAMEVRNEALEEAKNSGKSNVIADIISVYHPRMRRLIAEALFNSPVASNYQLIAQIGEGSFGTASLVVRKGTDKCFIMKTTKIQYGDKTQQEALNECRRMAEMKFDNNKRIVQIEEAFMADGSLAIIMDVADMGDLSRIKTQFPRGVPMRLCIAWFVQMVEGIEVIHSRRMLHRDIKPENIFLDSGLNIRIGDFGVSKAMGNDVMTNTKCGTPYYMAPEILCYQPYHWAADIWAIACVFYEMATGEILFPAKTEFELHHWIVKDRENEKAQLPSHYPDEIHKIFRKMLSFDGQDRPTARMILDIPLLKTCSDNMPDRFNVKIVGGVAPYSEQAKIFMRKYHEALAKGVNVDAYLGIDSTSLPARMLNSVSVDVVHGKKNLVQKDVNSVFSFDNQQQENEVVQLVAPNMHPDDIERKYKNLTDQYPFLKEDPDVIEAIRKDFGFIPGRPDKVRKDKVVITKEIRTDALGRKSEEILEEKIEKTKVIATTPNASKKKNSRPAGAETTSDVISTLSEDTEYEYLYEYESQPNIIDDLKTVLNDIHQKKVKSDDILPIAKLPDLLVHNPKEAGVKVMGIVKDEDLKEISLSQAVREIAKIPIWKQQNMRLCNQNMTDLEFQAALLADKGFKVVNLTDKEFLAKKKREKAEMKMKMEEEAATSKEIEEKENPSIKLVEPELVLKLLSDAKEAGIPTTHMIKFLKNGRTGIQNLDIEDESKIDLNSPETWQNIPEYEFSMAQQLFELQVDSNGKVEEILSSNDSIRGILLNRFRLKMAHYFPKLYEGQKKIKSFIKDLMR